MNVKTYRVRDMQAGIEQIKGELGPEAVILSTARLSGDPNGATLEITVACPDAGAVAEREREKAEAARRAAAAQKASADDAVTSMLSGMMKQLNALQAEIRQLKETRKADVAPVAPPMPPVAAGHGDGPTRAQAILRLGLAMMAPKSQNSPGFARAVSLAYQGLRSNGVLEADAEGVLSEAFVAHLKAKRKSPLEAEVETALAARLTTVAPLWHQRSTKPQLAVFLGATGVGKTTTVAKVAAQAQLLGHRKVGILCTDTFRIGAVYQLKTYADLIGVPMFACSSMEEVEDGLAALLGCDLILVDTRGSNPFSSPSGFHPEQLMAFSDQYDVQLHLCLAATTRTEDLVSTIVGGRYEGLSSLVFTKVDEAQGVGALVSVAMVARTPVSLVTTGPSVPDDLASPTAGELARWIRLTHPYGYGWRSTAAGAAESAPVAERSDQVGAATSV